METNTQSNVDANTQTSETIKKGGNFLTSLLSVLLLITCIIAGFFAYQTQNLVNEIVNLKSTATTAPSPSPSSSLPSDWKTYSDSVYGYSIKYPNSWTFTPTPSQGFGGVASFSNTDSKLEIGKHLEKIGTDESLKDYFLRTQELIDIRDEKEMTLGEHKVLRLILPIIHGDSSYTLGVYYTLVKNNEVYFIELYTNDSSQTETSDLIVSSLIFNEQGVCPQDAKICPDGRSVSRSGPNCEFPSCPKPAQQ